MELDINEALNKCKNIVKNIDINNEIEPLKNNLLYSIFSGIQKTAKYIIKALPVPDSVKDILIDVNDSLKSFNLKTILKTAINSSVREGLEILGIDPKNVKSLMQLKEAAIKGGLQNNLKAVFEIISKEYLNKNLAGEEVHKFLEEIKNSMQSNFFVDNINMSINKIIKQKDAFKENINNWYEAYDKLDIEKMNKISSTLSRNKTIIKDDYQLEKENKVIQNMTKMVNNKCNKLSDVQLQLCQTL